MLVTFVYQFMMENMKHVISNKLVFKTALNKLRDVMRETEENFPGEQLLPDEKRFFLSTWKTLNYVYHKLD